MFEALVQRLLNKILGQFIEDFSAENLSIGIWSGVVILKNVSFKKEIIKKLNLPFKIKYSRLGCLKMNIPWKSLTSSKIQVLLENFELLIEQIPETQWQCKDTRIIQKRKKQIQSYCESVINTFAKNSDQSKQSEEGYFSKLIMKIIDNLQITIKDIHIRYQNQFARAFSFGVTLEELKLYTVNLKGEPEYIDRNKQEYLNQPLRKRLELNNIGIYWNEQSEIYNESNYQPKMSNTIAKRNQSTFYHNYIILMSSQAKLLQRQPGKQFVFPQIDLSINLQTLKIEISNTQLQQMIILGQRMQKFKKQIKKQNKVKLDKNTIKRYIEDFSELFPEYYNEWGKGMSASGLNKLDNILQKMEIDDFTFGIKKYLQDKEKQRMMNEKKQKNKGWFRQPKELTPQQIEQIEKYLNENFSSQVTIIKRPQDYYYVSINFTINKFQVAIINTMSIIQEGIRAGFVTLEIQFKLRQKGFEMNLGLHDIGINMFKKIGMQPQNIKRILYKIVRQNSMDPQKYLKMIIKSNPLQKKYLNTDICLHTSELMIVFDPNIISIATQFADLKLNQQNKQAALQKYGEFKQKTQTSIVQSIEKPTKMQIGIDIVINTITVAIPFNPKQPLSDCWGVNFGSICFQSNQQTLIQTQIQQNQPLQVYNIKLTDFSFRHYKNINELELHQKTSMKYKNIINAVINNLDFQVGIQIYEKCTEIIPKLKLKVGLPELQVNINKFTYHNLLKIDQCFQQSDQIQNYKRSSIKSEKAQIMNKASKIGYVHMKDSYTKIWKRYVAIMSENFIYIYLDKKDQYYAAYYFIKGAKMEKYRDPKDKEKPFHFKIKNKLNEVIFGFDKEDLIEDWIKKITIMQRSQFEQEVVTAIFDMSVNPLVASMMASKRIEHNQLNIFVEALIESTNIKIYLSQSLQQNLIDLSLQMLSSRLYIHESKTLINLNLYSIELKDTLKKYKNQRLKYFLHSSHPVETKNLINIKVQQINKQHPEYRQIDSNINITFGILNCNYKCETVKNLLVFFVANEDKQLEQNNKQIKPSQQKSEAINDQNNDEHIILKLNLEISQIALHLVNEKIKTIMGKLAISNLNLQTSLSQRRVVLKGNLGQLYYKDFTNYPKTIIEEQQSYGQGRYLLIGQIDKNIKLLDFQMQMLKKMNHNKKLLLINMHLNNIKIYYTQQPILRIITFITTQMLPSLGAEQTKINLKDNEAKPDPTTMDIKIDLTNINVFVEPDPQKPESQKQFIKVNIDKITVKNESIHRSYVKSLKPVILVQNYSVKLNDMSIFLQFIDGKGERHSYKLTNNLNFTCQTDLIANPQYYLKKYGSQFENGLRTNCIMTPFFMRMNHDDYSFIMKCLNWSITHNDGAEYILFGQPQSHKNIQNVPAQNIQKLYLVVKMDQISVFLYQNNIPIAFLILNNLTYTQISGVEMVMNLLIQNLYGTAIESLPQKHILIQKGLFNALGYTHIHEIQDINNINALIKQFDKSYQLKNSNETPFLSFKMSMNEKKTCIRINIDQLIIDIDIKILYILIGLTNVDPDYIKGPEPAVSKDIDNQLQDKQIRQINQNQKQIEPLFKTFEDEGQSKLGSQIQQQFQFAFQINKLIASISERKKQKFIVIEGAVYLTLFNQGDRDMIYLKKQFLKEEAPKKINHSIIKAQLRHFTLYFCTMRNSLIKNKRQILKPMNINCEIIKFYTYQVSVMILSTDIIVNTEQVLLTVSLKDVQNLKVIMQDSTAIWEEQQPKLKEEIQKQNQRQIKKIQIKIGDKIQSSTKLKAKMQIIQIDLINDCNNSFMPVLRFIMQQTQPYMHQYLIKTHVMIVPIISILYFNPRSSCWQPIIETFKSSVDYLMLIGKDGPKMTLLMQTDKEVTGSLKINISTQMISTLLAAKQIASAQKGKTVSNVQTQEVEISSFIFHNITNSKIYLSRGQKQFEIQPLFKGPIRLQTGKQLLIRIRNRNYHLKLDHYGILKIPQSKYFIQYDFQKLNRIIKFLPKLMIKNCTQSLIYLKRQSGKQQSVIQMQVGDIIPLDFINRFAISLRGTSYTQMVPVQNIILRKFVFSEHKKFLVLLDHKQIINKFSTIEVIPPLVINNYLPKFIQLQFIYQLKTIITKGIQPQQTHQVCASQDINKLQFRALIAGYVWTTKFSFRQQASDEELRLQLEDDDCAKTTINYQFSKGSNFQYTLTLYCKKIIINEIKDKLIVYGNHQNDQKNKIFGDYQILGGQKKSDPLHDDKLIMVGEEVGNKIRVCGVNSLIDFATPICIGGLGSSQSRIVVDRIYKGRSDSLFTVVNVQISLLKISKSCDIFCKTIILRNQSIIINNTKDDISIMEVISDYYKFHIAAGSKQSFIFGIPDIKGKNKHSGVVIQNTKYQSKVVHLPEKGTVFFKMHNNSIMEKTIQHSFIYHKINVKQCQSYLIYQIDEIVEEDLPYEIIIKSGNIKVVVPSQNKTIKHGQIYRFIKEISYDQQHQVLLYLASRDSPEYIEIKVYPDDLNYRKKESLTVRKQNTIEHMAVEVYVTFNDSKKIINIDEVHRQGEIRQIDVSYILFNLAEIVLSINQNLQQHEQPYESLVLTLKRCCFIKNQTDKKTEYQFKLGFLQIDQAFPHTLSNPVIITPNKFQEFTRSQKPQSIFNSMIVINNELKQHTFINQVVIDVNDLVVQCTVDFINLIIVISKQYASVINFKEENYTVSTKLQTQKWRDIIVPKEEKKVFIKSITISPFSIDLSAQLKINKIKLKNNQFISTVLSAIGVVVSNIQGATISLDGIQITDCIDTADIIMAELTKRYKNNFTAQLYKIVGSLNIIGNPMGLLKNISTGFKDLRDKPAQGFVNGPAEFGLGIAQGARSLIAHSVGGAFKSLSGITGTFSTGLATLAFDKQFEAHRQKQKMKKPQNIIQGLQKGGKAILYGFKEGLAGVFLQPYQNARDQGALGFVKGTAKGLAGLVVKPVTGIIDFASKATQGIKNQALTFEDKPNEQRMRYPRVFYTQCYIMKEYCLIDSSLQSILKKVAYQDKFANSIYLQGNPTSNQNEYLVIQQSYVALVDAKKRKIKWSMDIDLTEIENQSKKNLIEFRCNRQSRVHSNHYFVELDQKQTCDKITTMILNLQKERAQSL